MSFSIIAIIEIQRLMAVIGGMGEGIPLPRWRVPVQAWWQRILGVSYIAYGYFFIPSSNVFSNSSLVQGFLIIQ